VCIAKQTDILYIAVRYRLPMGQNDMERRINNKTHGLDMLWLVYASNNQAQLKHCLSGGVNVGQA
jgi:hypothetical protein